MAKETNCSVSCGDDVVSRTLGKAGVNRSLLITLALLPWAWAGVEWVADALRSLWELVASVG